MNIYQEKLEARKERYEALANKNNQLAKSTHKRAHDMASVIPFGQPIILNHHSTNKDINFRNKIGKTFEKSFEINAKAKYYEEKAASVGTGGISSDDPEAIQQLQAKLEKLEAVQERMKSANKLLKKNDITGLLTLGYTESQIEDLKKPDFCGRTGYPAYAITNNGATIRNTKKRIAELEIATTITETVEKKYEGFIYKEEDNRCQFIFTGKPSEEIRAILKSYAYKWSPSRTAWVRMLTGNGKYAAVNVIKKLELI